MRSVKKKEDFHFLPPQANLEHEIRMNRILICSPEAVKLKQRRQVEGHWLHHAIKLKLSASAQNQDCLRSDISFLSSEFLLNMFFFSNILLCTHRELAVGQHGRSNTDPKSGSSVSLPQQLRKRCNVQPRQLGHDVIDVVDNITLCVQLHSVEERNFELYGKIGKDRQVAYYQGYYC